MFRRLGLLVSLCVVAACGSEEQPFVGQFSAPVVYGDDDRLEVYAHPSAELAAIARESAVALIDSHQLERQSDGIYAVIAVPLQTSKGLCDSEAFLDQPTAAGCSGVLIQDDLVLTAGHCIRSQFECERKSYVFNYHLEGPTQLALIDDDDVYECEELVLRQEVSGMSLTPDYAVIRLDRAVSGGHQPARVRPATTPLAQGEPVTMIGFGSGLPAKIDSGGSVADPRTEALDYFLVNSDAFGGHSGSAVFDSNDELAGILIAGRAPDYVLMEDDSCNVVNVFEDSQAGEAIQYFAPIVSKLCEDGVGDETLCGDTSCSGEPCGQKAPAPPGGGSGVPAPAGASGCQAVSDAGAPATLFGSLMVFALLARFRRSVA